MKTKRTLFLAATAGMVLLGLVLVGWLVQDRAAAQPAPPEGPEQPGRPGVPGGGMGLMMRMMQVPGALAVTDKYVYVLHGNTLYQFDAEDLTQLNKVDLPVEMPLFPPGLGGGPGGRGGQGGRGGL